MKTYLDMQKQKKFMVSIVALRKIYKKTSFREKEMAQVDIRISAQWRERCWKCSADHVYDIFLFKNISSKDSFEPLDAGGQLLELGVWIRALGTLHGGQDRLKGHCPALW